MLSSAPFLQLACLLVAGILCNRLFQHSFQSDLVLWVQFVVICTSITAGIFFLKRKKNKKVVALLSIACFLMGLLGASFHMRGADRQKSMTSMPYDGYIAIIKTLPEKRAESYRYEAEISHLIRNDSLKKFFGRALIQLPLDIDEIPRPGSIIQTRQRLKEPIRAMNPGSFDYGNYLQYQGIHYVDYLRNGQYSILGKVEQKWNPVTWSYSLSEKADEIFRLNIQNDDAYGLVKAMILGRRDDLRNELVDAFTISGAVHILSVSGLHVGIFFVVIQSLLGWLRRFKGGRFIQLILLSSMLLIYGLMTGMPASVERSVIMCLMLAIAATFVRNQTPLNTLGIAAFFILLTDPMAIYSIGFQLSFLAMVGLMVFNRPIEKAWKIQNKIGRYVWSMIAATVAAQITTLPLTLFYFHQFPTWFLLVNPLVIAISSILLPAAFLLIVISLLSIPIITFLVGWVVTWSAILTNYCVTIPQYLPVPVLDNIPFDFIQMLSLMIFILFFGWYGLSIKKGEVIKLCFIFCALFSMYSITQQFLSKQHTRLVFHSIRNNFLVSILDRGQLFLVTPQPLSDTEYRYTIKDYVVQNQVSNPTYILPGQTAQGNDWFVSWEGYQPVIRFTGHQITSIVEARKSGDDRNVHFIYSPFNSRLSENMPSDAYFILDNRLSFRQREEWRGYFATHKIGYTDLHTDGSFSIQK